MHPEPTRHTAHPFRLTPTAQAVALLCAGLCAGQPAGAATCTWDGTESNQWSNIDNWSACPGVTDGDDLVFPDGAAYPANTNNIGALDINSITLGHTLGYVIDLGTVGLYGGITATTGLNNLHGHIDQWGGPRTYAASAGATLHFNTVLLLNTFDTTFSADTGASLHLNGSIAGTAAESLIFSGTGYKDLGAANSFNGPVSVQAGTLSLGNAAALGTTDNGITVATGATLDLNGQTIADEALTLAGGGGVSSAGQLYAYYSGYWNGPVNLAADTEIRVNTSTTVLTLGGPVGGAGGFALMGPGILALANPANSFAGPIDINTYAQGSTLRLGASEVIPDGASIRFNPVAPLGNLNVNGWAEHIGDLQGTGNILLGSGTLSVGGNGIDSHFDGFTSDSGQLVKVGPETLHISRVLGHTGGTQVNGGELRLADGAGLGDTTVASGARLGLPRGAAVGNLQVASGGELRFLSSAANSVVGSLDLAAGSTLRTDIAPSGQGYIHVNGTVDLGGADLVVNYGYDPSTALGVMLIDNFGVDPVVGTFNGLPQGGGLAVAGGVTLYVNYQGGDGNDVVLSTSPVDGYPPPSDPPPSDPPPSDPQGPGNTHAIPALSGWGGLLLSLGMLGAPLLARRPQRSRADRG